VEVSSKRQEFASGIVTGYGTFPIQIVVKAWWRRGGVVKIIIILILHPGLHADFL